MFGPSGLSSAGMLLHIDGQDRLLFARVTNIIADGDGVRMRWDWRGATSLKACWKHFNVRKKDSDLARRGEGFIEIDCDVLASFRSWSRSEVYRVHDTLAAAAGNVVAGTMSKDDYNDLEASVGINLNAYGMLASTVLRHRRCKAK